jgi:hypothetical protein
VGLAGQLTGWLAGSLCCLAWYLYTTARLDTTAIQQPIHLSAHLPAACCCSAACSRLVDLAARKSFGPKDGEC